MNEVAQSETVGPRPRGGECLAQLGRILRSSDFNASEREHRFFTYIVEETLVGRGNKIKAYSIAVEVFGREASFDAQADPIVRIAAGHLRRALERYYLTAGKHDPIVITIPKGCYIPTFSFGDRPGIGPGDPIIALPASFRQSASRLGRPLAMVVGIAALVVIVGWLFIPAMMNKEASAPEIPRILVTKLEDLTKAGSSAAVANGLTQELVGQLSKFREIIVVQGTESSELDPAPRFMLTGSVDLSGEAFHLRVGFINREDGSVLWASSFDGALRASDLVRAQADIASNVATSLAQSYGVIFQADAKRNVANSPADWTAYSCTLSYYSYRANIDRRSLPQVRECLEKAVERFPGYATAWALLAQSYLEDIRFRFPHDPTVTPAELERALETARHAVQLDPFNVRGMQAEMFALFLSKQYEAGKTVGERALALNPNDTELMGEYGYRLAVSGEWEAGCGLIVEARRRNPGIFGYYESGLALCAYFTGNLKDAVMWIKKTTVPANPIYHLIAAAILAEAGSIEEAKREVAWLCIHQPDLLKGVRQEVSVRLGREKDVEFFLGSLKKAGLTMEPPQRSCPQAAL